MASKFSRADRDKNSTPWPVLFVIGIVAATLGQTGLTGYFTKEKELKVAEQQLQVTKDTALQELQFKRDMAVVDRALDPNRSAEDREQVVNFLIATTKDGPTKEWAEQKKASLQAQVTQLKEKLQASEARGRAIQKVMSMRVKNSDLQRQLIAALEDEIALVQQSTKPPVATTTTDNTGTLRSLIATPTAGSLWRASDAINAAGNVNYFLSATQTASYTGAITIGRTSNGEVNYFLGATNPTSAHSPITIGDTSGTRLEDLVGPQDTSFHFSASSFSATQPLH